MSGHSKWSQIKHKKGVADAKKGQLFSKITQAISVAAKKNPNPDVNIQLRSLIEKAKINKIPAENIERAIKRASEAKEVLEELIIEAYGPSGTAFIIEAITDNKNRTISEIKKILSEFNGSIVEPGGARWAFNAPSPENNEWRPKFKQEATTEVKEKIKKLIQELENNDSVQKVFVNIQI